jgi:hypothetical protein
VAASEFLDRVFERIPGTKISEYHFRHWNFGGKPTDEGVGLMPMPGADPERILARVMDVDHYVGNVNHVAECRSIDDAAYPPPQMVRFYQRIKIPLLGDVHHELVMERVGHVKGFEVACWHLLSRETLALSKKTGIRSHYNDGAWLVAPGLVGYALSSAPERGDVGLLKWKAITAGANVAASKVVQENIQALARWAARGS